MEPYIIIDDTTLGMLFFLGFFSGWGVLLLGWIVMRIGRGRRG
jgi:hypothetical protein